MLKSRSRVPWLPALCLAVAGALAVAPPADAQKPKPAVAAPQVSLSLPIQRLLLENGLRVVLSVDRISPAVAVAVVYDVGSRDEEQGRSGFAHLFEHMMFQGSKNVERGDHARLIAGHGGALDGMTSPDCTTYFDIVPANELALALWLEADRMKALSVTEERFANQREVVKEEYRKGVSSAAFAKSAIRLSELVYEGYWPYAHDTLGSMADLDAARFAWVRDFHAAHYGPDSAVLAIAGDFDVEEAKTLVQRYFGGAARMSKKPFHDIPLPEQKSPRTAVVKDDNARAPGVMIGWAAPPVHHADHHALRIAALVLGDGATSRLHQLLVRDRALAQRAFATMDARRGPGLFSIDARLVAGAKAADAERIIDGEIKALATRGPLDAELDRARQRAVATILSDLQRIGPRAIKLAEHELFLGDARQLNGEIDRYLAVSRQDVQRVVRDVLTPTRRSVVETSP